MIGDVLKVYGLKGHPFFMALEVTPFECSYSEVYNTSGHNILK
jgi:hypothetical protein